MFHISFYLGYGHTRTQERVFTERLFHASPTQIAHHVDTRSKYLFYPHRIKLARNLACLFISQIHVERTTHSNVLRIYCCSVLHYTMQRLGNREARNSQSGLFYQIGLDFTESLTRAYSGQREAFEETIATRSTHLRQAIGIQLLSFKNIPRMQMTNLGYLLFQSHSLQQVVYTHFRRYQRILIRSLLCLDRRNATSETYYPSK